MVNLNVLSVNGNTNLADTTYAVSERSVYWGYTDNTNANQTYVEIEEVGKMQRKVLLVNDSIANVITSLNAGTLLKVFFAVTVKKVNDFEWNGNPTGKSAFLNMENIAVAWDYNSDAYIQYFGENTQSFKLVQTDQTISTITSAAADISAGAETIPYPLTAKTIFEIDEIQLVSPKTYLLNEKYISRVLENFDNAYNVTATAAAKIKIETHTVGTPGSAYRVNDILTAVGGTGTAATFTISKVKPINGQTQTSYDDSPAADGTFVGGTGHANGNVITLSDGTTITVVANAGGVVTQFTVNSAASTGSTSNGSTLTQSSTTGAGVGFTLTMDTNNQTIHTLLLTTAGSYTVKHSNIASVATTGSATGTGAILSVDYEIDSFVITNAGSGYSSAPVVTVSGGGGTGGAGTAVLSGDRVQSITATAGDNYTDVPTVSIAAPASKTVWGIQPRQSGQEKLYMF